MLNVLELLFQAFHSSKTKMELPTIDNVQDLDVGDLLSLLDCPQKEVSDEVKNLLKDEFRKVKDSWLISGLLEYFFATNRFV